MTDHERRRAFKSREAHSFAHRTLFLLTTRDASRWVRVYDDGSGYATAIGSTRLTDGVNGLAEHVTNVDRTGQGAQSRAFYDAHVWLKGDECLLTDHITRFQVKGG